MLGQDGADYAVSGCSNGTLGEMGRLDNHIRISGVRDLSGLQKVDITYPGSRWHFPCEDGQGWWQIVVKPSGEDQLDLYFESGTAESIPVDYTVMLEYDDGTSDGFVITDPSGVYNAVR